MCPVFGGRSRYVVLCRVLPCRIVFKLKKGELPAAAYSEVQSNPLLLFGMKKKETNLSNIQWVDTIKNNIISGKQIKKGKINGMA